MVDIDSLVEKAVFNKGEEKIKAGREIRRWAWQNQLYLASINNFYLAIGRGEISNNFTVPAINLRGLTYDIAQLIFSLAKKFNIGAFILEIARSEIDYTDQSPEEYAVVILAAAVKTGYRGPIFLQGDHFQLKNDSRQEIKEIKKLIKEAVAAGFYNLDIDASTLVDYSFKDVFRQQEKNYQLTVKLAEYIRMVQPKGIDISIGGEIGHIGGRNSTEEELRIFMKGFKEKYHSQPGLSKISVQTGTHHGGVVLPNGQLAKVNVDFAVLQKLSRLAKRYGMGGAVQHGASTLPEKYLPIFPRSGTLEIHLATEFQNIIFDHPDFPKALLVRIYRWLEKNLADKKEKKETKEQFYYKWRKKAWGKFKKEIWSLPPGIKSSIMEALKEKLLRIFKSLRVINSRKIINKYC